MLCSHIRKITTVKDQVTRLRQEGGEMTRKDPEVCEEFNTRIMEVFPVETEMTPAKQDSRVHQQELATPHTTEEVKRLLCKYRYLKSDETRQHLSMGP